MSSDAGFEHILTELRKQRRFSLIPSRSEKEIRGLLPLLARINDLEAETRALADDRLAARTGDFRARAEKGEPLDNLLPEAFATVREAARRRLNMRHFDVQLVGGIILFRGNITEMSTGEGKTLVATLPLYLKALEGRGAHLVTVNDYLARRDRHWMGPVYESLGLTVGAIQHDMPSRERREAYAADITYGTNNEFGFDYLRDNMVLRREEMVQRDLHYAIVDEVDSILVDEARTPLIISGPAEDSTTLYGEMDRVVRRLISDPENFQKDEKAKAVFLTEEGIAAAEKILGVENLYDEKHFRLVHHIEQSLKAHIFFARDQEYLVQDGKVVIVDEFTGRTMPGRRFSDGLHQALEAKEKVPVEAENQTLATISFQNYFRLYRQLAGMTGTAYTELAEFKGIYDLDVIAIPTNRPLIRVEQQDEIYKSAREKFEAVTSEIEACHATGQPILVGTVSIEKSEHLSRLLVKKRVPHQVLNAKHHEKEAAIVAEAGRRGRVTIATNMAGRGTDIVLGGSRAEAGEKESWGAEHEELAGRITEKYPTIGRDQLAGKSLEALEVILLGGLHIIATERHEARRIDNQLRGRSGRQGDPGDCRFYLSLEDDLLRIFGSEKIMGIMSSLPEGEPISNPLITRMIETSQRRVEGQNYEIRKQLVDFDNVMNEQRRVIYEMRRQIIEGEDLSKFIAEAVADEIDTAVSRYFPAQSSPDTWEVGEFERWHEATFRGPANLPEARLIAARGEALRKELAEGAQARYAEKRSRLPGETADQVERHLFLFLLDSRWKAHLREMDGLREGISLRAYGQRDPVIAYKSEGFALFAQLQEDLRSELVKNLFALSIEEKPKTAPREVLAPSSFGRGAAPAVPAAPGPVTSGPGPAPAPVPPDPAGSGPAKIGRNDPCPCGSGRKHKKCCGRKSS